MTTRAWIARLTLLRWFMPLLLLVTLADAPVGQEGTGRRASEAFPGTGTSPTPDSTKVSPSPRDDLAGGCAKAKPNTIRSVHPKVERYSKVPEAEKINVNLLRLEEEVQTKDVSLAEAAANMGIVTVGSGVMLDIHTSRLDPSITKKLQIPGVTVRHVSPTYRRVSVVIDDPALLYELAKIPEVRTISPEYGARTNIGNEDSRNKARSGRGTLRSSPSPTK